ncbi:hypothetical protein B0H21DRAFT_438936 [Amylocystis lapponica]|nr:hypothetical protein B0H21DRAFT_438936 [Amylocystis lapponica]
MLLVALLTVILLIIVLLIIGLLVVVLLAVVLPIVVLPIVVVLAVVLPVVVVLIVVLLAVVVLLTAVSILFVVILVEGRLTKGRGKVRSLWLCRRDFRHRREGFLHRRQRRGTTAFHGLAATLAATVGVMGVELARRSGSGLGVTTLGVGTLDAAFDAAFEVAFEFPFAFFFAFRAALPVRGANSSGAGSSAAGSSTAAAIGASSGSVSVAGAGCVSSTAGGITGASGSAAGGWGVGERATSCCVCSTGASCRDKDLESSCCGVATLDGSRGVGILDACALGVAAFGGEGALAAGTFGEASLGVATFGETSLGVATLEGSRGDATLASSRAASNTSLGVAVLDSLGVAPFSSLSVARLPERPLSTNGEAGGGWRVPGPHTEVSASPRRVLPLRAESIERPETFTERSTSRMSGATSRALPLSTGARGACAEDERECA